MNYRLMGGDPELLCEKVSSGLACPPTDFLPFPKIVTAHSKCGGFNRDGLALELNPTPGDAIEVSHNLENLMNDGARILQGIGLRVHRKVGMDISSIPEEDKTIDLYEMGCMPDFNAYTQETNKVDVDAEVYPFRFAGGHMTVQIPELTKFEEVCKFVRYLDSTVGLLSLAYGDEWSKIRRQIYGKAGAFRWKDDKGIVEYRTPDAGFLLQNASRSMYVSLEAAVNKFLSGDQPHWKANYIVDTINESKIRDGAMMALKA